MNSLADSTEKLSKVYNSTRRPLCDEAYEAIKLLLAERGQPQPDRFPHQNTTELFKRETIPMIIGLILGTILGFLLRPSVPLIGQLPFGVVVTRGQSLGNMDMLFIKGAAEASFNYMLAGAILGGVFGFFGSLFIKE